MNEPIASAPASTVATADGQAGSVQPRRRASDGGVLCWIALRFADLWDWFDKRDIDKHIISGVVLWYSFRITEWAMHFIALHPDKPVAESAALIAAVMVPWSGVQAGAIAWVFKART